MTYHRQIFVTTKTKLGDFYAGTHSFTVKVEAYAIATTCVVVVAKKVWGPKCQSVGMYRLVFVRHSIKAAMSDYETFVFDIQKRIVAAAI